MWSNILSSGEAAKERLTTALKETNDALSQRASAHAQQIKKSQSNGSTTSPSASIDNAQDSNLNKKENDVNVFSFPSFGGNKSQGEKSSVFNHFQQQNEILDSLKTGWGNVVEVTKNVVETTKDVVEKEQTRIQATLFNNGPYLRGTC